jgi:hypothetical protein
VSVLVLVSPRLHAELWFDEQGGWSIVDERLSRPLSEREVRERFGDEPFHRLGARASLGAGRFRARLVSRHTAATAVEAGWTLDTDGDDAFAAHAGARRIRLASDSRWGLGWSADAGPRASFRAEGADLGAMEAIARAVLRGTEVPPAARASVYWDEAGDERPPRLEENRDE